MGFLYAMEENVEGEVGGGGAREEALLKATPTP